MKRRLLALVAAGLITLGVLGDRLLSLSFNQSSTVVAETTGAANTDRASIDQATEQAYATASKSIVYIVSKGVGSGSGIIYDTKATSSPMTT
jgi:hypothetical protein